VSREFHLRGVVKKEVASAARENGIQFLRVKISMPITTQLSLSPKTQTGFNFLKEIGEALKSA